MSWIDGLKASISGTELKDLLRNKASEHRARAINFQGGDVLKQAENSAILSFLSDHLEEDKMYRIDINQVITLGLYSERL